MFRTHLPCCTDQGHHQPPVGHDQQGEQLPGAPQSPGAGGWLQIYINCENEVTGEDIVLVIKEVDNMIFEESKHGSFSVFGRTYC